MADELPPTRFETLETAVRRLLVEVSDLRREVRSLRAIVTPGSGEAAPPDGRDETLPPPAFAPTESPAVDLPAAEPALWRRVLDPDKVARSRSAPAMRPAPRSRTRPSLIPKGMSFEDLVGRYGAMALAALAIMSAVGIFLSWAIAQNLIGPAVRVAAGFAAAAALGALGWRFRTRGARTFGNTLMGIALAVVHVVAWGAGPGLGVFPAWLALATAAAASIALAILAWRTMEESLFVVGVGGALIAPFVTTPHGGNGEALLIFGWLVLTTALYGMRERPWRYARWLLGAAGVAYAGAAMTATWSLTGVFGREIPVVFALACAWGALALGGAMHGPSLTRAYLVAALPPLFYDWDVAGVFQPHVVLAATATITFLVAIWRWDEDGSAWLVGALLIPLAFMTAALVPLRDVTSTAGVVIATGWAIGTAATGWWLAGPRREALWAVAALASGLAIVLAVPDDGLALAFGLSAHAALVSLVMRRERAGLLFGPILLALLGATYAATWVYDAREAYSYTPFSTRAALAGFLVVLGWAALGWNASRTEWENPLPSRTLAVHASLGIVAAFVWGHVELASAYSPDISTFLLIFYYASCGVAAIFVGRRDSVSDLRRVGLALAIFAALKAVAQAYELDQVGLRVGSFLLVGGFLLAVAYWYRSAGETDEPRADAR